MKTEQLPLNDQGKASKRQIILPILREELARGGTLDRKKVLLAAQKRLERYPANQRDGVVVTMTDVNGVLQDLRQRGEAPPSSKVPPVNRVAGLNGTHSVNGSAPRPILADPPVTSYTAAELLSAGKFLAACGNSVVRARNVLDIIATITKGE